MSGSSEGDCVAVGEWAKGACAVDVVGPDGGGGGCEHGRPRHDALALAEQGGGAERFVEWLRERNASSAAACERSRGLDLFGRRSVWKSTSARMVIAR